MSLFRTSFRLPRFRTRLPSFRIGQSVGGANVGAGVSGAALGRTLREGLDLDDLLKGAREEMGGVVGDAVERGEVAPDAAPERPAPPQIRRRGPATLLERRDRLDYALRQVAGPGAHVEYQANTIAVINNGNVIVRILRFVLGLPLIPLKMIMRAVEWVFRPRGAGRLKRTVVFIDRRGNVVVYRM